MKVKKKVVEVGRRQMRAVAERLKDDLGAEEYERFRKIVRKHVREVEQHFKRKGQGWPLGYHQYPEMIFGEFVSPAASWFIYLEFARRGMTAEFRKPSKFGDYVLVRSQSKARTAGASKAKRR